jgi:hypothetical protein
MSGITWIVVYWSESTCPFCDTHAGWLCRGFCCAHLCQLWWGFISTHTWVSGFCSGCDSGWSGRQGAGGACVEEGGRHCCTSCLPHGYLLQAIMYSCFQDAWVRLRLSIDVIVMLTWSIILVVSRRRRMLESCSRTARRQAKTKPNHTSVMLWLCLSSPICQCIIACCVCLSIRRIVSSIVVRRNTDIVEKQVELHDTMFQEFCRQSSCVWSLMYLHTPGLQLSPCGPLTYISSVCTCVTHVQIHIGPPQVQRGCHQPVSDGHEAEAGQDCRWCSSCCCQGVENQYGNHLDGRAVVLCMDFVCRAFEVWVLLEACMQCWLLLWTKMRLFHVGLSFLGWFWLSGIVFLLRACICYCGPFLKISARWFFSVVSSYAH